MCSGLFAFGEACQQFHHVIFCEECLSDDLVRHRIFVQCLRKLPYCSRLLYRNIQVGRLLCSPSSRAQLLEEIAVLAVTENPQVVGTTNERLHRHLPAWFECHKDTQCNRWNQLLPHGNLRKQEL